MNLWLVDDHRENREAWLASFPPSVRSVCRMRTFESVPALFAALDDGERPDVLFVDYFLGPNDGMEVIERLLREPGPPPLLIAHSSVPRMNEGMVRGGAHLSLAKVRGEPRTRSIVEAIRSVEDLRDLVARHVRVASRRQSPR